MEITVHSWWNLLSHLLNAIIRKYGALWSLNCPWKCPLHRSVNGVVILSCIILVQIDSVRNMVYSLTMNLKLPLLPGSVHFLLFNQKKISYFQPDRNFNFRLFVHNLSGSEMSTLYLKNENVQKYLGLPGRIWRHFCDLSANTEFYYSHQKEDIEVGCS